MNAPSRSLPAALPCPVLAPVVLALLLLALAAAPALAAPLAYVSNSADNTVSVIDTASQTVAATTGVGALPYGVAVDRTTGTAYVTNQDDGTVSVLDGRTGALTRTIALGGRPFGAAVSPDGSRVYVTNMGDDSLVVIDSATGAVLGRAGVAGGPAGVAVSPDGATLYVARNSGDSLIALDADSLATLGSLGLPDGPLGVAVLPSGTVYVSSLGPITGAAPTTVAVVDPSSLDLIATVTVGIGAHDLAASPDGAKVYVSNFFDGTVSVIDTATNTVVTTIEVNPGGNVAGIDLTPSGALAYVANVSGNAVAIIDTADDSLSGVIPVGGQPFAFGTFIGPAASDDPPQVLLVKPADGVAGVDVDRAVTAVFNKALDPASLTSDTFSLETAEGAPVEAEVTYDAATFRAKLKPKTHLQSLTGYVATLGTGVTDASGTPLAGPVTWSFTTSTRSSGGSCAANPTAGFGLEWALLAGIAVFLGRKRKKAGRLPQG
jgi:YVTN family beta-propeller protein